MQEMEELKRLLEEKNSAVKESQARFHVLFENSPFSMQILDDKGTTVQVNKAWRALWGLSDEFIETNILNIYNILKDPLLTEFIPYFERAYKGETVHLPVTGYEPHKAGKPGLLKYTKPIIFPLLGKNGKIHELLICHEDVTDQYYAVEEKQFLGKLAAILLESLEYQTTLEHIAIAATPYFADGCVIDLVEEGEVKRLVTKHSNPQTEKIMRELVDKYPPTFDSPQPTPRVLRTNGPELLEKIDIDVITAHCYNKEHEELIISTGINSHIAVPLIIRGETIGALNFWITTGRRPYKDKDLVMAQNISYYAALAIDNARLYRDSQQAISQREDFISIASHELKTPVTALILQMEIMQSMLRENNSGEREMAIKVAESSIRQLDRLSGLIEDMLDLTRISRKKLIAETMSVIDLKDLILQAINRFTEQFVSKKIDLNLQLLEGIRIKCDPPRLEQVIANVLSNAILYGGSGSICISMEITTGRALIKIKDHGIGISPKFHERIFQRFERVHSATDGKGLGLGLFICKQIMQEHNGTIYVESELGKGSEFFIDLPRP